MSCALILFVIVAPPCPPLFPYTTLFRSDRRAPGARRGSGGAGRHAACVAERHVDRAPEHAAGDQLRAAGDPRADRKSTRLNSSHVEISYAVFCLKKKNTLILPDVLQKPD